MEKWENPAEAPHINGWVTISKYLRLRAKNQSDLARKLRISPAAVSQIKNGGFRLNSAQLAVIAAYLGIRGDGLNELYTELFTARMAARGTGGNRETALELRCFAEKRAAAEPTVPVGTLPMLDAFCPAVEPLHCFVGRLSPERTALYSGNDICAIRIPGGRDLPAGATLVLADRYPESGETVLARCGSGKYMFGKFRPGYEAVRFCPPEGAAGEIIWSTRRDPLWISWMRPVVKMES